MTGSSDTPPTPHPLFASPEVLDRFKRNERVFRAHDRLAALVNKVLDEEGTRMTVRGGRERLLSTFVGAALGRTIRDFQAIERLCLLDFAEQAMIVLRSAVNLLINVNYITKDEHPVERVEQFLAYSYKEFSKFVSDGYGQEVAWEPDWPPEVIERKAKIWKDLRIRQRAERLAKHHYDIGYRFYSAIEHSDVLALLERIDWDADEGPFVGSGSDDKKIEVALAHGYMVMAEILHIVCEYFGIARPDVFDEIRQITADVAADCDRLGG